VQKFFNDACANERNQFSVLTYVENNEQIPFIQSWSMWTKLSSDENSVLKACITWQRKKKSQETEDLS
jgi:hypothetical protein